MRVTRSLIPQRLRTHTHTHHCCLLPAHGEVAYACVQRMCNARMYNHLLLTLIPDIILATAGNSHSGLLTTSCKSLPLNVCGVSLGRVHLSCEAPVLCVAPVLMCGSDAACVCSAAAAAWGCCVSSWWACAGSVLSREVPCCACVCAVLCPSHSRTEGSAVVGRTGRSDRTGCLHAARG